MVSLFQKLPPFSVKTYAIIYISAVTLLFSISSGLMLNKIDNTQTEIERGNQRAAQAEIAEAVNALSKEMKRVGNLLVAWDETRQQLSDPSYYGYWRDSRVLESGVVPNYVKAIELYDRQGQSLSAIVLSGMPEIAERVARTVVRKQGGRHFIYISQPVMDEVSRGQIFGYIVIKIDFQEALLTVLHFRFADPASLTLSLPDGESSFADVSDRISFKVVANQEMSGLLKYLTLYQYQVALIILLLAWVFYEALVFLLAKPLLRLSQHIDTLREGRDGQVLNSLGAALTIKELENVRNSLNDYQSQLETMHASLDEKNIELWTMAHRDPLTGIFNRRCFEEDWQRVLSIVAGNRVDVSFLLFDCDYFKAINDTYGHEVGDRVIQSIAHELQGALRSGDRLYRLGGDEFACVFLDADFGYALDVAKRCVRAVDGHDFSRHGVVEPIHVSVGISHAAAAGPESLSVLQKQADVAMYLAKRPGYGKIVVYTDEMASDGNALFSNQIANAVFEAIVPGGKTLEMHYQPVVSLATKKIDYYEALVRIRHESELIMPDAIFPVVEGRRLEVELDFAVMRRILEDIETGLIPRGSGVSINISGPAIAHPGINDRLAEFKPFLKTYKLVLEITETALITQLQEVSAKLAQLRSAGFVVALDDFGSGYSSLGYLANMPVDVVKFDISLIRRLDQDDSRGGIVESLALMIRKAGYLIVAEGIETERTLEDVARIGCSHGQGYLLGRPTATPQS